MTHWHRDAKALDIEPRFPRFIAVHDGDIASGVKDRRNDRYLFWMGGDDAVKWAENIAYALNETLAELD